MREYKLNEYDSTEEANGQNLPQKVSLWSKIKNFLFQEIDLSKPIVLELTPKEEKVLTEVHDFLFQEVKFPELHDFLFQEIHFFGKKKNKAKQADVIQNSVEANGNVDDWEKGQNTTDTWNEKNGENPSTKVKD